MVLAIWIMCFVFPSICTIVGGYAARCFGMGLAVLLASNTHGAPYVAELGAVHGKCARHHAGPLLIVDYVTGISQITDMKVRASARGGFRHYPLSLSCVRHALSGQTVISMEECVHRVLDELVQASPRPSLRVLVVQQPALALDVVQSVIDCMGEWLPAGCMVSFSHIPHGHIWFRPERFPKLRKHSLAGVPVVHMHRHTVGRVHSLAYRPRRCISLASALGGCARGRIRRDENIGARRIT